MHEDPTRTMGQPGGQNPHGNMRLLVAGLIAVIIGLVVAIVVIAGDDGSSDTVLAPSEITTLPTATTEPTTATDTTSPTTTTTTTSPTTTATETTTTTTEEDGSGGIEAP